MVVKERLRLRQAKRQTKQVNKDPLLKSKAIQGVAGSGWRHCAWPAVRSLPTGTRMPTR